MNREQLIELRWGLKTWWEEDKYQLFVDVKDEVELMIALIDNDIKEKEETIIHEKHKTWLTSENGTHSKNTTTRKE